VAARLLDGQVARHLLDRDRRELDVDLGGVLGPPEEERPDERAEPLQRLRVATGLDRRRKRPLERLARAQEAGINEIHDRPELTEPVLDRRAGQRERTPPLDPPACNVELSPRVSGL